MGAESGTDRLEGALLALLEHEGRRERWESLPPAVREEAVEQLARMMLRVVEGESGHETGNADRGAAP